mmetsp:Transcript_60356/g.143822  ORF Transcript_60356/g.143822 Transcript_60356/m.143822 type:complete len:704 (-) Transcript_60356:148-2259(-)|eukprot:CAMPEP_0178439474 /NCGR_PEP_ID=MMETSP0689_2-20121128/36178_1 /TAXON_ID=160604 /ORGANISM="Amphidinium massartii, Strain CS-259" /LENGTH=703 /DNA_ID=CAMNT_0020062011 /DNA_START=15 /DNA_END=2126 /DNA_ORIENTATION=-
MADTSGDAPMPQAEESAQAPEAAAAEAAPAAEAPAAEAPAAEAPSEAQPMETDASAAPAGDAAAPAAATAEGGSAAPAAPQVPAGDVKVKQERTEEVDEDAQASAQKAGAGDQKIKAEDTGHRIKEEAKVKAEKKDDKDEEKEKGVKTEAGVKAEAGVKSEVSGIKQEVQTGKDNIKGEPVKGEVKGEAGVKGEVKGENVKGENVKGEVKGEGVKGETKGELKGELKGERVKGEGDMKNEIKDEIKRERSRSKKKKKDKKQKDGKIKTERTSRSPDRKKKDKKDKRKRSRSAGGTRKRKSKWGPDVPMGFNAVSAGRGGIALPSLDDNMPRFSDDELKVRTIMLLNVPSKVTGQELIEFFNGAVLAVTANAVQQASNKQMAPVFACTITEEDYGGGKRQDVAELKFRTTEGASVGMKLNGIDYKGNKITTKRPEGYPMPADGVDPSVKINLHEMSMARLVGTGGAAGAGGDGGPAPKLSIFNLPDVMTEQIVRDLLSQFGKLRVLSLIRDLQTGKLKGYGIFEYDDPADVELAVLALNGFVCGANVIRVQKLGVQEKAAAPKPQPVAATAMSNSMTQKIVANPVLAMQVKTGREVGSRPSTIVQLINAVYQEDLMGDDDYDDIMAEVHSEAAKHGQVARVIIPKPAKDGAFVDGVGKIFVQFQDLTAARKFQLDANGRKFENRVVCAAFYPVDKFEEGKFKLF